ncbi:MAG: hypothetical protein ACFCVF_00430 [Kineosporiaceae bacterium]
MPASKACVDRTSPPPRGLGGGERDERREPEGGEDRDPGRDAEQEAIAPPVRDQ